MTYRPHECRARTRGVPFDGQASAPTERDSVYSSEEVCMSFVKELCGEVGEVQAGEDEAPAPDLTLEVLIYIIGDDDD